MELEERKCPLCDRVVQDSSMPDDPCVYFDCECGYVLIAPREKPIADAGGIKCDMAHICRQAQQTIEGMEERERHHRMMKGVTDMKDQASPETGAIRIEVGQAESQCSKATHKDLCRQAREEYEYMAKETCSHNSVIQKAINFYEKYGEQIVEEDNDLPWTYIRIHGTSTNAIKGDLNPMSKYHRCVSCGTVFTPYMYGGAPACSNVNDLHAICIACGSNATEHMSERDLCAHLDRQANA